jgi:hypothetical protein
MVHDLHPLVLRKGVRPRRLRRRLRRVRGDVDLLQRGRVPMHTNCTGHACGDDGCGGSCGTCSGGQACSSAGQCACVPNCEGKTCGPNGCGGTCGAGNACHGGMRPSEGLDLSSASVASAALLKVQTGQRSGAKIRVVPGDPRRATS